MKTIAANFGDSRIKYFRNSSNLGHDFNIIESFGNSRGKFVLLLRSSDYLIPEKIPQMITFLRENQNIGYCRFSCEDEMGNESILYKNAIYPCGEESLIANRDLLIHPSGEIYNKELFSTDDWETIKWYLREYFETDLRFVVHIMMRDFISVRADIVTSNIVAWRYTRTDRRKDVAHNKAKDRSSVYAPIYQYQRYNCELSYVVYVLHSNYKNTLIDNIIEKYARAVTVRFMHINWNSNMQKHYAFEPIKFSPFKEIDTFVKKTNEIISDYPTEYKEYILKRLKCYTKLCVICWLLVSAARRCYNYARRKTKGLLHFNGRDA